MKRRHFFRHVGRAAAAFSLPVLPALAHATPARLGYRRVRPADAGWPAPAAWNALDTAVGGRLIKLQSPFASCTVADSKACGDLYDALNNPYFLGDAAGLTQAMGWADAWVSQPSAYAVACQDAHDVAAAINFARKHKLRLVVKGGGHSYQGTSCAPDSLLIWTRKMNQIVMHDAFVGVGCAGKQAPAKAVTVDAGALWMQTYNAVTSKGGRYVQGGGCATVGVAGLIQSGGFGSYSKQYGLAAASLLEAEIVTADGVIRIVNACKEPEVFWAIKGGGGGSLGVVTRVTLRTHDLPEFFGIVRATIRASSDDAYQRLIGLVLSLYADKLFNAHWGEQLIFKTNNTVEFSLSFLGLDEGQAKAQWQTFFDAIGAAPNEYKMASPPVIAAFPAKIQWNPAILKTIPGVVKEDKRPGAAPENVFWSGNEKEAGKFINGYQSAWVPATLLQPDQQQRLVDALFAATRAGEIALHLNKGLAGAPDAARAAAKDTAMNPLVLGAFALAICASEQARSHPLLAGHAPNLDDARDNAQAIDIAMNALRAVIPEVGSYVSESNYFEKNWQRSFWGSNYPRLLAAKQKYDPDGLFFVHHGVGSEQWSDDGFTRKS